MNVRTNRSLFYIVLFLLVFTVCFGLICRFTVLAKGSDQEVSEEEVTTEDHLSQEELDHILRVSEQWLKNNPVPEVATSTDPDYDTSSYMTYPLDLEWIDDNTSVNSALNDIYRMLLSIRNILVLFFFGFVIYWFDKKLHAIINRLFGGR